MVHATTAAVEWRMQQQQRYSSCNSNNSMAHATVATAWLMQQQQQYGACNSSISMTHAITAAIRRMQQQQQYGSCNSNSSSNTIAHATAAIYSTCNRRNIMHAKAAAVLMRHMRQSQHVRSGNPHATVAAITRIQQQHTCKSYNTEVISHTLQRTCLQLITHGFTEFPPKFPPASLWR